MQRSSLYYDDDDEEDIPPPPIPGSVGEPQLSESQSRDSSPQAEPVRNNPSIGHPSARDTPPLRRVAGVRVEPSRKSARERVPAKHPNTIYEEVAQGRQSQSKAQRAAEAEARKDAYETVSPLPSPSPDPQDDVQEAYLLATLDDVIAEAFAAHDVD